MNIKEAMTLDIIADCPIYLISFRVSCTLLSHLGIPNVLCKRIVIYTLPETSGKLQNIST